VVKGISSSESGVEDNKEAIQQENESMNHMEQFFRSSSHLLPLLSFMQKGYVDFQYELGQLQV
jgi:hypothetical protein